MGSEAGARPTGRGASVTAPADWGVADAGVGAAARDDARRPSDGRFDLFSIARYDDGGLQIGNHKTFG